VESRGSDLTHLGSHRRNVLVLAPDDLPGALAGSAHLFDGALRPGRNPYEVGQKSASKIGSSTSLAAV
jgi:hypothetical protein